MVLSSITFLYKFELLSSRGSILKAFITEDIFRGPDETLVLKLATSCSSASSAIASTIRLLEDFQASATLASFIIFSFFLSGFEEVLTSLILTS